MKVVEVEKCYIRTSTIYHLPVLVLEDKRIKMYPNPVKLSLSYMIHEFLIPLHHIISVIFFAFKNLI